MDPGVVKVCLEVGRHQHRRHLKSHGARLKGAVREVVGAPAPRLLGPRHGHHPRAWVDAAVAGEPARLLVPHQEPLALVFAVQEQLHQAGAARLPVRPAVVENAAPLLHRIFVFLSRDYIHLFPKLRVRLQTIHQFGRSRGSARIFHLGAPPL